MNISIIPRPLKVSVAAEKDFFTIDSAITVKSNNNTLAFNELNAFMNRAFGYTLAESDKGGIIMQVDKSLEKSLGKEGYFLTIGKKAIEIKAAYENGVFYGVESLKQLIVQFMTLRNSSIPLLEIEDRPLYRYRGYMLDVCRHFLPVEDVLKVIDTLSLQKINTFHWHLTEDQGWRIRIDKYPELTAAGARRDSTIGDGKWHGGYYSKADIKKVVDYCKSKFITVIPEIDLPGHSMAAAAAYNYLTCTGKPIQVATTFGIKPDIFCAGKESTYKFLFDVLDEVIEMFPGEYIHLGGDEAPKVRWAECPECQKAIKENNLVNEEQLQGYFLNRLTEYLKKKDKKVICWNESIYSKILDPSVVCQYWSDGKTAENVINEMNKGRKGIISKFTPYYLDYPHAMHSVKKVYNFVPELKGISHDADIMGIEAPLWTEYVDNLPRLQYMTFPRLGAIAEIAWTDIANRDYRDFSDRLANYYKVLDIYNVKYAPRKDINPGPFKGMRQMFSFSRMMCSKEAIKAMKESLKVVKAMKDIRKEL